MLMSRDISGLPILSYNYYDWSWINELHNVGTFNHAYARVMILIFGTSTITQLSQSPTDRHRAIFVNDCLTRDVSNCGEIRGTVRYTRLLANDTGIQRVQARIKVKTVENRKAQSPHRAV